ncbi:hypothetical protein AgCh_001254 [Apium graveolens]
MSKAKKGSGNNTPSRDRTKVKCYNCNAYGHYASECRKPRCEREWQCDKEQKPEANLTQIKDDESALLPTKYEEVNGTALLLNEEGVTPRLVTEIESGKATNVWYLDNRASNHMTGVKSKFSELNESITGKVKFGDGFSVSIRGRGIIVLKCKNGESRKLNKEMAVHLLNLSLPKSVCGGCLMSKKSRRPFPQKSNFIAKTCLELIRGDICGPINPPTSAGNRYFLLLVDDFSRLMWIYLLKNKDEALDVFGKFKLLVEKGRAEKMKVLRMDRGGEFFSTRFKEFYDNNGIKRHYMAPYSPQQNGVIKRRNRTVVETARSLLKERKMPLKFWGEAVRHAVYILN